MPRYFYNLSSTLAFMKASLNVNIHSVHTPAIQKPLYKLYVNESSSVDVLPIRLDCFVTKKNLLSFDVTESNETLYVEIHHLNLQKGKELSYLLGSFLNLYAKQCGHCKIHLHINNNNTFLF